MKKAGLVLILILLAVTPLFSEDVNQLALDNNRVTAPSDGENPIPVGMDDQIQEDPNILNAMTEKSNEGQILQQQKGITVTSTSATPTPMDKKEDMFKNENVVLEEKNKSKEEIEEEVKALYAEGKKYYAIEDYAGAAEIWERLVKNYPTSNQLYEIRYSLANAYEFNRDFDKAIIEYQKVLAEKPKLDLSIEATYRLADCYARLEKWQYAIEIYKDIIMRSNGKKDAVRAYFNLAAVYNRMNNKKRAENVFKNIVKYYPNTISEVQARFQLASMYAQTGRYKSAIKEYLLIKMKFKDSEWAPMAAMHIGDTYKLAGEYKNAKDAYSKVLYEYYRNDTYVKQAEERIVSLKHIKEVEKRVYGE